MYAVEFQAPIENGVVYIPQQYQDIQDTSKATFVVMYESEDITISKDKNLAYDPYFNERKEELQQIRNDIKNGNSQLISFEDFENKTNQFEKELELKYAN